MLRIWSSDHVLEIFDGEVSIPWILLDNTQMLEIWTGGEASCLVGTMGEKQISNERFHLHFLHTFESFS
jgi:hypothetical protein